MAVRRGSELRTAGVLLAAGGGSRFVGRTHKLLATLDGRAVVEHALRAVARAGFAQTAVVTGAADLRDALHRAGCADTVAVLHNPRWSDGIAASLAVGIDWAAGQGCEAVVVGLGDQPFVPASAWRAVAESDSPIAVARYGGVSGNPVRLARATWPLLARGGDEGARALMRVRPEIVAGIACEGRPHDIDTMEDLHLWN